MVYKIRNKSMFWTRAGWKNNWHPKNFNSPRPCNAEFTVGLRCRYDHHSFLRMHHQYRQLARFGKQYLMGDTQWEQAYTLALRNMYLIPLFSHCLTDQIKHGGERRMADQIDRDVELMSYNQHPYQLFMYESRNNQLAKEQEEHQLKEEGQKTQDEQVEEYVKQVMQHEEAQLPQGQKLSIEKKFDILYKVLAQVREQERNSYASRTHTGEMNDQQDVRRPFVSTP